MIVSTEDSIHLNKQVTKDLPFLIKKEDSICKHIIKTIGHKGYKKKAYKNTTLISYLCPREKTLWNIFYRIAPKQKIEDISFIDITKIDTKYGKEYVVIQHSKDNNDINYHIFSGHFIKRISERSKISVICPEKALAEYLLDGEFSVHNFWEKKTAEMRHINKWGISLGKYYKETKIMRHKTFINKNQLFKEQQDWIKDLFAQAILHNSPEVNKALAETYPEYVDFKEINICDKIESEIQQKGQHLMNKDNGEKINRYRDLSLYGLSECIKKFKIEGIEFPTYMDIAIEKQIHFQHEKQLNDIWELDIVKNKTK